MMNIALSRWLLVSIGLSLLGLADATYLTVLHYQHVIPPCTVAHGCTTVLTSSYATIGAIPVALLGIAYYAAMLFASLWSLWKRAWTVVLALFAVIGFCVTLLLVGVQLFILHAVCTYCMVSAGISTLLFALQVVLWRAQKAFEQLHK